MFYIIYTICPHFALLELFHIEMFKMYKMDTVLWPLSHVSLLVVLTGEMDSTQVIRLEDLFVI